MDRFSRFFSTIAERWPAATRCLEEYERLLAPTKKEYVDFLAQKASFIPEQAAPIGDMVGDMYVYPTDLDDAVNFWTVCNPTTTVGPTTDPLAAYAYNVSHDWNAEFNLNFGIEAKPEI